MSGILLPGQENQPKSDEGNQPAGGGSGLELPSGFGSHKKKNPPKAPVPEAAPKPAPAPRPDQARGGQPELKYPPSGAQVQCPNCGTAYTTPVFTIIDLGADPMLKGPLLGGQINTAICPSCNAAGQLSVPMMLHIPEERFLGVYVPQGGGINDVEGQKMIGNLTQTLMRNTPQEDRKGYMLQPQQFLDWTRLIETVWGFDGVTPEMLNRQRDQGVLMQSLLRIGNDETALKLAAERNSALIDQDFFGMIEQMAMSMSNQGQKQAAQGLLVLYEKLMTMTEAGKELLARREQIQAILAQITPQMSREQLLDLILENWTEESDDIIATVVMQVGEALDYQFLMILSQRLETSTSDAEKEKLNQLRELILAIQEQQQQSQQAMVQQVQTILQEVLQANDTGAALAEYADYIDENFLALLGANIQSAQKNNAAAAVKRLQSIYQQAIAIYQRKLPPEVQLIQALMGAPDSGVVRKLLQENRPLVTKEFVETMSVLEQQMRAGERTEQADKLKSLRGQVALML